MYCMLKSFLKNRFCTKVGDIFVKGVKPILDNLLLIMALIIYRQSVIKSWQEAANTFSYSLRFVS